MNTEFICCFICPETYSTPHVLCLLPQDHSNGALAAIVECNAPTELKKNHWPIRHASRFNQAGTLDLCGQAVIPRLCAHASRIRHHP